MSPRLRALLRYIAPRVPSSTHLRIVTAMSDFEAYRNLGHPISDTPVWRKSREFAYPDGMTERQWNRETRRVWRQARPRGTVLAGDLIAAYVLWRALKDRATA